MAWCPSAEIPGITLVLYTQVGLFVMNRSRVFCWKVGFVTTWVRPLSAMRSMNLPEVLAGYIHAVPFPVVTWEVEVPTYSGVAVGYPHGSGQGYDL